MTHKAITLKFVIPIAVALGILQFIGAIYLKDKYLVPIDQAEASHNAVEASEIYPKHALSEGVL